MLHAAGGSARALVLLAGDAAGLANPVTGAGIAAGGALRAPRGRGAARCGGHARSRDGYARSSQDLFGASLERALRRRRELLARRRANPPEPSCAAAGSPSRSTGRRSCKERNTRMTCLKREDRAAVAAGADGLDFNPLDAMQPRAPGPTPAATRATARA